MAGSPDNTVILHWDECRSAWAQLSWLDWVRFRRLSDGGRSRLAGAQAGEHYFLVCVLEDDGELANVIPHRYVLSPTAEDLERYDELGAREFAVNLPPVHTVLPLMRAIPGVAGAKHSAACWDFLSAIGVCRSGTRAH